jgi:RimJ/RimL family protein N-acetyltransferase
VIPLPDPPLVGGVDLGLRLRPWRLDDAPALVAAWADPEIQRWTEVPEPRDRPAAERWIAGADARRERWLSLDLVVERDGAVAGEVGLATFDRIAGTAEIGWWTAAAHRRRGVATAAATLVVGWAIGALGLRAVLARCDTDNPASVSVAERAGAMILL